MSHIAFLAVVAAFTFLSAAERPAASSKGMKKATQNMKKAETKRESPSPTEGGEASTAAPGARAVPDTESERDWEPAPAPSED